MFVYENTRFVMLSGKNTGNLEVTEIADSNGVPIRVTKLERTLIDIVVRPTYSGGVFEVLEAYRGARDRISVSTLLATLKKLDYIYPYHQAIGFYMERASYPESVLARLERLPRKFNFYLTHKTVGPKYDQKWRVYYPTGLE
jgi:predicted transcriptional regulator of viral defense system